MVEMAIKEFLIIPLRNEELIRSPDIVKWCRFPYHGHKRGCPNSLGPEKSCKLAYVDDIMEGPFWFICAVCDFEGYRKEMKALHPNWSDRQLRNPLYWQGNIRKRLKKYTRDSMKMLDIEDFMFTEVPEGFGVNVVETLESLGYRIERRPDKTVWKVNMIAKRKSSKEQL